MTAAPFMQLYVGDYLADTTDLTTEQHGAYLLLLMTMWRHNASLPNEPYKLARIARVSPRRWHQVWGEIGKFFYEDGATIRNNRLDREHEKATSLSQKRSASGALGGAAKAMKTKDVDVANATDLPHALPQHSQTSDIRDKKKTTSSCAKALRFEEFWGVYPHRNGAKKGKAPAKAKYDRAVADGIEEQILIDAARRYSHDRQVRDGYAKDPATWLNQKGWQDEVEAAPLAAINGGAATKHGDRRTLPSGKNQVFQSGLGWITCYA